MKKILLTTTALIFSTNMAFADHHMPSDKMSSNAEYMHSMYSQKLIEQFTENGLSQDGQMAITEMQTKLKNAKTPYKENMYKIKDELQQAMIADDFNKEAFVELMKKYNEIKDLMQSERLTAYTDMLSSLSVEDRKVIAKVMSEYKYDGSSH